MHTNDPSTSTTAKEEGSTTNLVIPSSSVTYQIHRLPPSVQYPLSVQWSNYYNPPVYGHQQHSNHHLGRMPHQTYSPVPRFYQVHRPYPPPVYYPTPMLHYPPRFGQQRQYELVDLTSSPPHTSSAKRLPVSVAPPIKEIPKDIEIQIRNVVCNFSLPLHIDLRKLALTSWNCCYNRSRTTLTKQQRNPSCLVKISSSGKFYMVGCKSEAEAYKAARSIARKCQKIMGKTNEKMRLQNYHINNIMANAIAPFGIMIQELARKYPKESYYEPELTTGLIFKMAEPKASLRIFATGTIAVIGATSVKDASEAIKKIYDIVKEFQATGPSVPRQTTRKRVGTTTQNLPARKRSRGSSVDTTFFGDSWYDDDDDIGNSWMCADDEFDLDEFL